MTFLKFSQNYKNLKKSCRLLGFTKFIKKTVYHRHNDFLLIMKDLNEDLNYSFKDIIEIKNIEKNDLHVLEEFCRPYDLYLKNPEQEFYEYFKNDCKGFVARLNGNIIGYHWWGDKNIGSDFEYPELAFMVNKIKPILKNDDICGFDLFIDPKNRGGGIVNEFILKFFSSLKKLGYNRVIGCVKADNRPALWTYRILGYKEINRIAIRRIFLFIVFWGKKMSFDTAGHKWIYRYAESNCVKKGKTNKLNR